MKKNQSSDPDAIIVDKETYKKAKRKVKINDDDPMIISLRKTERILISTLIPILIFTILTPWIATLTTPRCLNLDFTKTGDIGSTIGGVTAPFMAFISAILVYFSFRAQMIMNIQQRQMIISEKEEKESKRQIDLINELLMNSFQNNKSVQELLSSHEISSTIVQIDKYLPNKPDLLSAFIASRVNTIISSIEEIDKLYNSLFGVISYKYTLKREDLFLIFLRHAKALSTTEENLILLLRMMNSLSSLPHEGHGDIKKLKNTISKHLGAFSSYQEYISLLIKVNDKSKED